MPKEVVIRRGGYKVNWPEGAVGAAISRLMVWTISRLRPGLHYALGD